MKKILTAVLALTVLAAACACAAPAAADAGKALREADGYSLSANAEAVIEAKDVTLDKNHLEMKVGAQETLTATVLPSNAADQSVAWKSGNTAVLTVSGGTITAVAEGSTTVEAKIANGQRAVCQVKVVRDVTDDGLEMKKSGYIYYEDFSQRSDVPTYLTKDIPGKGRAVIEEGALRVTVVRGSDKAAFLTHKLSEPMESGTYTVEAKLRADSIEFANLLFFFGETNDFYDTGAIVTQVAMQDNYFKNNTGGGWGSGSNIVAYDVGKWYEVRMVIDMDAETYDFYVDGTLAKSGLKFRKSGTAIRYLRFGSENEWADLSIEYIRISKGE